MRSWTILSAHNFYRQPGGEDLVFAAEAELLERAGHIAVRYEDHNLRISAGGMNAMVDTLWSRDAYNSIESLGRSHRPDVVHFHNTFPLISPSAYYAAARQGAAVVQTLHNYRLLCAGATFFRDGRPCEDCITASWPWRGAVHGCYRGSRPASLAAASMVGFHRVRHTWTRMVDAFIVLSKFAREKFVLGGLPPEKIFVKPNFLHPDPGKGTGAGGYALFIGRIAIGKGLATLLDAWERLPDVPLKIVGDGPLARTRSLPNVTWAGQQPHAPTMDAMRQAAVLIFPSIWYEMAPLTIIEAFAAGLPVIASDLGAAAEMVRDGHNGLLFRPGDAGDLAAKVRWAFEHPEELQAMRAAARREYEEKYTAERNYKMLMDIYETAIENARRESRAAS
jgi:glycosyltransferase involved in cell wall biosynthesis